MLMSPKILYSQYRTLSMHTFALQNSEISMAFFIFLISSLLLKYRVQHKVLYTFCIVLRQVQTQVYQKVTKVWKFSTDTHTHKKNLIYSNNICQKTLVTVCECLIHFCVLRDLPTYLFPHCGPKLLRSCHM
jgi:hypothetical protein